MRDGALHPWRRRRTRARIEALARPGSIVFLCLGNVCRSPYAAYRFEALVRERGVGPLQVLSAGFIGPGRAPADLALAEARARGIDTGGHVSTVIDRATLDGADLVVLVDPAHGRRLRGLAGTRRPTSIVLGDLDPEPVDRRTIRDPWGQDPEVFRRVFDRIDRCLDELAARLFPEARP